jgi:hypothetical protein
MCTCAHGPFTKKTGPFKYSEGLTSYDMSHVGLIIAGLTCSERSPFTLLQRRLIRMQNTTSLINSIRMPNQNNKGLQIEIKDEQIQ